MNDINELVDLPDPATHPLDLPPGTVLWGAAAMLVAGAAVGIWKLRS